MKFDFDEMMNLHKTDPIAFETKRTAMIESVINDAPEEHRPRLRKLQFELDQRRTKQPEFFLTECLAEMTENVALLAKAWGSMTKVFDDSGHACGVCDCTTPPGEARNCKWGWECQAWRDARK